MACDLQYSYAKMKFKGPSKIIQLPEKTSVEVFNNKKVFVGFAGEADKWALVINWFADPSQKPPKLGPSFEMLMLDDKKNIYHATDVRNWFKIHEPYFAIGTGMHFALAAMASDKTPLEAVKIAAKYDPSTGLGYKALHIK
jgi:ATP-dependent protease HslVU (ClpYQ) peptidase subunit